MILEPWKSRDEIDRRLSALNDPELAELLRAANREFLGHDTQSYAPPSAPYWKKRIAFLALAGLIAMSAGYAGSISTSRQRPRANVKPHAAVMLARHRRPSHVVHHAAPVRTAVAPVHAASAVAPSETLIRQARAQVLHERAIAEQAQAESARAQHQAKLAMQAQAAANARALESALAQARAQARAEAIARAQTEGAAAAREQEQALQNATDPNIKPGDGIPPATGRMSTNPVPSAPVPVPGPIDPNCTPHRGSLFTTVLSHVRIGGTNVGEVLRIIHNP